MIALLDLARFRFVFAMVLGIIVCSSCGQFDTDINEAKKRVDEFRSMVRDDEYGKLHAWTSQAMRNKVSVEELRTYLQPLRFEIGAGSRKLIDWKIGANANVGYLFVLYYASDDQGRDLKEEFIFVKEGEKLHLLNYRAW